MIAIENLPSLELRPPGSAAAAVYDRAIGMRALNEDDETGEEHCSTDRLTSRLPTAEGRAPGREKDRGLEVKG